MIHSPRRDVIATTHGLCRMVVSLDDTRRDALAKVTVVRASDGATVCDMTVEQLEMVLRIAREDEQALDREAVLRRSVAADPGFGRALADALAGRSPADGGAA